VIGDTGMGVSAEVDQRVPRGAVLGMVAPTLLGLVGCLANRVILLNLHDILLISHVG
jgi:hypothetical protein